MARGAINNLQLNRYLYGGKEYQDAQVGGSMLGLYDFHARYYNPVLGRWFNQDPALQLTNPYNYCGNSPMMYVDPDGEFITWSFGRNGLSIGLNFGFGGFGINIGWRDGGSFGVYGEAGPRVGGTGLGSGATITHSLDYGFKSGKVTATTSAGVYGSLGPLNATANVSYNYNQNTVSWGVGGGLNLYGNDAWGFGLNVGYGSDGWSYGFGGYHNPNAWNSNPTYEPEKWNDNGQIQWNNNCYSYALDDPNNPFGGKPQPGQYSGGSINIGECSLENVLSLSLRDGRVKKPSFWNKLGFGKKGYYSVYLVIDNQDAVDYHWYRQDKGGKWSHKSGNFQVKNLDSSGKLIYNPARANHNYGPIYNGNGNFYGNLNYSNGGRILWIKR